MGLAKGFKQIASDLLDLLGKEKSHRGSRRHDRRTGGKSSAPTQTERQAADAHDGGLPSPPPHSSAPQILFSKNTCGSANNYTFNCDALSDDGIITHDTDSLQQTELSSPQNSDSLQQTELSSPQNSSRSTARGIDRVGGADWSLLRSPERPTAPTPGRGPAAHLAASGAPPPSPRGIGRPRNLAPPEDDYTASSKACGALGWLSAITSSNTAAAPTAAAAALGSPPKELRASGRRATTCGLSTTLSTSSTTAAVALAAAESAEPLPTLRLTAAPPSLRPVRSPRQPESQQEPLSGAQSAPLMLLASLNSPPTNMRAGRELHLSLAGRCSASFVPRPLPPMGPLYTSPAAPTEMVHGRTRWSTGDYQISRKLYAGYSSGVYKATCRYSGSDVVLKTYNLAGLSTFLRNQVLRELDIHSRLRHPSVVHLIAAFREQDSVVMVQEYIRGGSLDRVRRKLGGRMTEFQAMHLVLLPLLGVLSHLHERGILHRDIKPENLLFTEAWQLKVCDYGVSICLHEERAVTRTGTREYFAPEVDSCPPKRNPEDNKDNEQLAYTPAVDVWSLGALMYELLVGFTPFPGGPPAMKGGVRVSVSRTAPTTLSFPSSVSQGARSFVRACLELDPAHRPTIQELTQHPWIQEAMAAAEAYPEQQNGSVAVANKLTPGARPGIQAAP